MVSGEKMDFDTFAGKFFKGRQDRDICAEYNILVTVPEVEEIA